MRVDRKWVERNLGFDPIATPPPDATFAFAHGSQGGNARGFPARDHRFRFRVPGRPAVPGLHHGDRPVALHRCSVAEGTGAEDRAQAQRASSNSPLPRADVLVVTWTVDEGHALSRVLTPGKDSRNDYLSYTHNFADDLEEDAQGLSGAPGEASRRLLDDDDRRANRSSSSSRTRTCRRTVRNCRTSMCGARSSRRCGPSS